MEKLEKVESLRTKAGVSYEEAKAALEANDWDVLDAMIALEKEGKVAEPKMSSYTTKSEAASDKMITAYEDKKKAEKKSSKFFEKCKELFDKANRNSLEIDKDGKMILTVPVSIFILLLIFCFWAVVPLMIVGLFFSMHYQFSGPDIRTVDVDINAAMETASKTAETIKNEFASKEKKENKTEE